MLMNPRSLVRCSVTGCRKLRDAELSMPQDGQDPHVVLEYAATASLRARIAAGP